MDQGNYPNPGYHNPAGGPSGYDASPYSPQQAHHKSSLPPKKKMSGGMIALIVIGIVLILCAVGGVVTLAGLGKAADSVSNQIEQNATSRLADVKIKSCKQGSLGSNFVDIAYTVTNSSDTKQSYLIQFDVYAANGTTRLGEVHGIINDLAPGATTNEEASGTVSSSLAGAKCKPVSA